LLCSPSTLCLDTLFTSSDKKISGFIRSHVIGFVADLFFSTLAASTRYRIRCRYIFFHSGERIYFFFRIRCRILRIRVDGSHIRKEKVADSKISGYVWTGRKFVCRNRVIHSGNLFESTNSSSICLCATIFLRPIL